ncbi:uncharacterized protein LOC115443313 [Manduca sexta]|uniref:uncharacterized protein LOC115443313 n=1 Tax=Manduca sexta TaxID=7130 RepID=UPI00188E02D0|nr:uncharacterized protein LOC115443313 [Manduca sexta]
MRYKITLFVCFALLCLSNCIKVNMQGSLTMGRDVMDALSEYVNRYYISGRRSMNIDNQKSHGISTTVQSVSLCNKLDFCRRKLKMFLNEYIIAIDSELERIFEDLKQNNQVDEENKSVENPNNLIFKEQLKLCLKDIKRILKMANEKISEENEAYVWTDVIKKISAKFQETAQWFVNERLEGNPDVIGEIKSKLMQEIITSTAKVESKFQSKLCAEHNICTKSYECTKGLNALLIQFNNTTEEKVKNFVRTFYELLPETGFYSKLRDVTGTEFQVILNDMSYGNVVTKDVFMALHKSLQIRLKSLNTNTEISKEKDVELLNLILSDMDHFYSKHKPEPFYKFLDSFNHWSKFGGRLNPHVKQLMKDISQQISEQSETLFDKLVNEVRVFLEITVDPEQ